MVIMIVMVKMLMILKMVTIMEELQLTKVSFTTSPREQYLLISAGHIDRLKLNWAPCR